METTNDRDAHCKPPPLNSDQLNYLIWRYLQDSGYGEAAVKLQRDWNIEPEDLPFAKHIKGPALVSLVQKGLRYHHLSLTIDENGRSSKALQPSMFFFGPESLQPPGVIREVAMRPTSRHQNSSPDASANGVRKHPRDIMQGDSAEQLAQPAPKRPKKTGNPNALLQQPQMAPAEHSNGNNENASMEIDTPPTQVSPAMPVQPSTTRSSRPADPTDMEEPSAGINGRGNGRGMDVDLSASTGAGARVGAVEPQDQAQEPVIEPVPPPPTLANGKSEGVQVDPAKVADLTPATTILATPEAQHVTKLIFRPNDPETVAAYGVGFCGVWKTPAHRRELGQQQQNYHSIFEDEIVTALAWEPNGTRLAVATYANQSGSLHLYDGVDFILMERLPGSQRVITTLRWLPGGFKLVGLAPYDGSFPEGNKDTAVLLWDLSPSGMPRSSVSMPEILVDVDTADSTQIHPAGALICISGVGAVYHCRDSGKITIEKKWNQDEYIRDRWDFIKCARRSQLVVAASSESSSIWIPATKLLLRNRHDGQIVGLEMRPTTEYSRSRDLSEDFATASTDDAIKIWRYDFVRNAADILFKVRSPSLALSYSPDGSMFAGATYEKLRIWNADHGAQLLAEWDGTGTEWRGPGVQGDDTVSNGDVSMNGDTPGSTVDHSLTWDANGKKIAFGLGGQIAVINFQR